MTGDPSLPLSHVHLVREPEVDTSIRIPCESGDSLTATLTVESMLVTLDDIERTMPDAEGLSTMPTVRLTRQEAVRLLGWLSSAITAGEADLP